MTLTPTPSEWKPQFFQSGTSIVTRNLRHRPHYYVYAPGGREM